MRVDCEGYAGCCIGWRPVAPTALDYERRGPCASLDSVYNLVPLTRDEVRDSVEAGFGNTLSPRLWEAPSGEGVEIDGIEIAAVDGEPAFLVGMCKPPKSITPFGLERTWLRACAFLDPETFQCRIYDTEFYPGECAEYPGRNLVLEQETECEHVGRYHSGKRLLDDATPDDFHGLLLGPHTLGTKLSVHPEPERLAETTGHLRRRELTPEDRTEFAGVAVGSHPDSTGIDDDRTSWTRTETLENESQADEAVVVWDAVADCLGSAADDALDPDEVEVTRGAPETPG